MFIDANIYLRFYDESIPKQRKMLEPLLELKKKGWLFVTQQIVNEVNRNKLRIAVDSLAPVRDAMQLRKVSIPSLGVTDGSSEATPKFNEEWRELVDKAKSLDNQFAKRASHLLRNVSSSTDEVSVKLAEIFLDAFSPSEVNIQEARKRKEFSDPPGKAKNPIGDELSWLQYIGHLKTSKSEVWLVTGDSDYALSFDKSCYLNPVLWRDLCECEIDSSNVHVFDALEKALDGLKSVHGQDFKNLPSRDVLAEIGKEHAGKPKEMTELEAMSWMMGQLPPGAVAGALLGGLIGGVISSSGKKEGSGKRN